MKVLTMCQFTPSMVSLTPSISGIVSTDIVFIFTYMCTQYLHHIHPPIPFPHKLPPPTGTNLPLPPDRTYSTLLFCNFVEEKKEKMTFLLV
jgi:hypothetical protein